MSKPYSYDLRQKVIQAIKLDGLKISGSCVLFSISRNTINGIKLQIWATWLFYAVLLDVADAVADELELCTEQISLEMLFRGFSHFNHAYSRGKASDPIAYFSARENQDLRIVKYEHKSRIRQQLNLSPYPT